MGLPGAPSGQTRALADAAEDLPDPCTHETRTIDLPPGTYRVKVTAQHGYQGAISNEVVLTK